MVARVFDSERTSTCFLGFDGLMQTVAVASSEHHTTCKLIDDDYLTVS